ncbi:MAG: aldehyde ferredoxin oxidoreductase family protein [Bacillota bacterium]|nr:aldehyde ferredoxin oxidoreductase family protein [Bacillota bacterium]
MAVLLKVDLTTQKIETEDISSWQRAYLGGLGLNSKLAYELIPGGCSPLDEDNVLLIGAGSLVGTFLPTACRTDITSKSPLSGRYGSANAGCEWGVQLRLAGFDHIAITGKADRPLVLYIDNGRVYLEEASFLWGEDTWFTTDWIKEHKGKEFEVASIGPAGENLVAFASIQNNYYSSWGRTGMGAVMGSKKLKAVAVRGNGRVAIANEKEFSKIKREAFGKVTGDESFGWTRKYGSMIVSTPFNRIGALPGRNFRVGSIKGWEETRARKFFVDRYKEKDLACFSCPIACTHWSKVREGPFKNYEAKGLEVTFVLEFGAKLDLASIPEILKSVEMCNRLGIDVISGASVIAFVMECFEKEVLQKKDIGFSPQWGDYDSILKLLHLISFREGIGEVLSGGVKKASEQISGSGQYAMHIKGVEIPCRDPRAKCDVWAMGYLINTRGGDHLRVRSPVETLAGGFLDFEKEELGVESEQIQDLDMPVLLKEKIFGSPPSHVYIPQMMKYAEDIITIINSVGLCIRPPVLRSLGPDFFSRALNAATGSDLTEESILAAAGEIWKLQHQFNEREGQTLDEFRFPERFYREPLPGLENTSHPPISENNVKKLLDSYFKIRNED